MCMFVYKVDQRGPVGRLGHGLKPSSSKYKSNQIKSNLSPSHFVLPLISSLPPSPLSLSIPLHLIFFSLSSLSSFLPFYLSLSISFSSSSHLFPPSPLSIRPSPSQLFLSLISPLPPSPLSLSIPLHLSYMMSCKRAL